MSFKQISVAQKLWAVVLGLLALMGGLAYGLQAYLGHVDAEAARVVNFSEQRITLVLRWKGMIELTGDRVVNAAMTSDEILAKRIGEQIKAGVDASSEAQKRVGDALFTAEDKAQFERIG